MTAAVPVSQVERRKRRAQPLAMATVQQAEMGGCTIRGEGGAGPGAVSGDGGAGGEIEGAGGAGDDISGGGASGKAGGDIIHATPISADDFTTWSPVNWSSVPWMQVTLDKDSPVFWQQLWHLQIPVSGRATKHSTGQHQVLGIMFPRLATLTS